MRNTIMCIVLIILGIGFTVWGYGVMNNARASLKWPITRGTVITSEVKTTSDSGKSGYQHSANIRYTYRVDGKDYTSGKIVVGDYSSNSSRRARKLTSRYRKGSQVKIYYNPVKPGEAVLKPGGTLLIYAPFAFGIIAAAAGISAFFYRMKSVASGGHSPPYGKRERG